MAAQPQASDNPTVQQHYVAQAGLATALAAAAARLRPTPDYLRLLAALTREFQAASISLSADYYTELREQADVPGVFRPPTIEPWDQGAAEAYMKAATERMVGEAEKAAQAVAMAQNMTANAGVEEVFASIDGDPRKVRWARVTRPGACAFCMLNAIRGAVYRTETTASFRPHMQINGKGGNCQCTVEPDFTDSHQLPAHVRAARKLYYKATNNTGESPAEKRNAFRRAFEASQKTTR